ncbi:MAG TPA: XkdF-like putative serine protease domain-containing protein [Stellaceae bacterium]|nr:XkdF-like putative serine protease domain-containing protein [Stellaceae bacterium]
MRFYAPIAKVDAEQRMVWGYASTDAEDDQGEIITRDALGAALADYLKFANIREMHQMSAVGVAEEASVDDKGLYVGARIVDPRAWDKVTGGVYKGFSVGGKVRARDARDRNIITALTLTEISLVDRPANPEAVFDCWKSEGGEGMGDNTSSTPIRAIRRTAGSATRSTASVTSAPPGPLSTSPKTRRFIPPANSIGSDRGSSRRGRPRSTRRDPPPQHPRTSP